MKDKDDSPYFKCIVCKTKDASPIYWEYCSAECATIGLHRKANKEIANRQ